MKQLETGLWYLKNREKIVNVLKYFLIFISATTWGVTIFTFGYYFIFGIDDDRKMVAEMVETKVSSRSYLDSIAPKPIQPYQTDIIKSPLGDKYDFVNMVKNNNLNHWGEFTYRYTLNGQKIYEGRSFILPNEYKYVYALGLEIKSSPHNALFEITGINWRLVDRHKIPDWNGYKAKHLNFKVLEKKFESSSKSGLSEKVSLNSIRFTLVNDTAYSINNAEFIVILHNSGRIVGANKYVITDFISMQTRTKDTTWPGFIGRVDAIEIMPDINILDDSVFGKPQTGIIQAQGSEEKR